MKENSEEKQFAVSVVMAVYNVGLYLREAIDSIVNQTFGFERIQLILVDDGSVDNSGSICDEYAQKYPENILAIHKENGGVSSARNEGLNHVRGQFVNFLDADDKLSEDTVAIVYDFFMKHLDETDVVAFPMQFFDGRTGEHYLNYKFKDGDRIIDLNKDWSYPQLSFCSTFVKAKCFEKLCFDTRLAYAEDAQLMQKVLARKASLGVLEKPVYWYRRRIEGPQSAIQSGRMRRQWYLDTVRYFHLEVIEFYLKSKGYLPLYTQYVLMYDLQWRLKGNRAPENVLTQEEDAAYLQLLQQVLSYIQPEVIMAQKNSFRENKLFALRLKDSGSIQRIVKDNDIELCIGNESLFKVSDYMIKLEFFELNRNSCVLEGIYCVLPDTLGEYHILAQVGDQMVEAESYGAQKPLLALGEVIQEYVTFKIRLPLSQQAQQVQLYCMSENALIPLHRFRYGRFFPISNRYRNGYYHQNGWVVTCGLNGIQIAPQNKMMARAIAFYAELLLKFKKIGFGPVIYCIALQILKPFKKKRLWLVSDRVMKAGDNGEAFFRYMRSEHPEIDTRFVINGACADYQAMKKIGPVVKEGTYFHKLLLLMSDCIVSSSAETDVFNPFQRNYEPYRNMVAMKKFVFLQHGVTKDDLSSWLNRFSKNISGFVTTALPEYDSIVNGAYQYTEKQVWLTGFPRFDRLYQDSKKWVTIMPTWRKYLMGAFDRNTDVWRLKADIENSSFIRFYNSLLNDRRLLEAARKYGYEIKFLPHPNLQEHLELFQKNEQVTYLGRETEYRDIFAHSDLVVTDYSSTVFDFVYLRKPVLYTHFDVDEFFSGSHAYSKGYFDYERDGFGEVEYDLDGTVNRMIEYMENSCQLKDKYRDRVESFFAFNDQNNCQRVYEKLMALDKAED